MAKRTPTVEETEPVEASTESIRGTLEDKFGKIIFSGQELKENIGRCVSTGLVGMDIALNGGVREGTIFHIGGITGSGKTSFSLSFLAEASRIGKNIYYVDVEGRLQPELLKCISGLDIKKINIIKSTKEDQLTAEKYIEIIESLIRDDPGCVVILDSLAALCPEAELAAEITDQQRATIPKLMAKFLRRMAQIIPSTGSILVTLTHMQANPSGYGSPFRETGGNSIQFFASYWMNCISSTKVEDKTGKTIGKDSKFRLHKVATGPPDGEPQLFIRFGKGCDKYMDLFKIACDIGIIKATGAWYTIELDSLKDEGGKLPKLQGENKVCAFLEDPKVFDTVAKEVKALCLK